jgi:uncharacterized protein (TIGR02996 family)
MPRRPSATVAAPSAEVLGLLQDVRAHYEDDAPRLVLADWLDDHGEPDRAELIRLSLERAKLPAYSQGKLLGQEAGLWERRKDDWLGAVAGRLDCYWAERGLFAWEATAARFLSARFQAESGAFPWVCELRLRRASVRSVGELGVIERFPSLWRLALGDGCFRHEAGPTLAEASFLGHLAALELTKIYLLADGVRLLAGSPHLANLEELDLTQCGVSHGAPALAEAPVLVRLRKLRLKMNGIDTQGAIALATSPHLTRLEELALPFNQAGDDGARAIAASPNARSLRRLNLQYNFITDAGARALLESPHLGGLTYLNLHYNAVSQPLWRPLRERFGHVDV